MVLARQFTLGSAPSPSLPGRCPSQHKTPGWPPETAQRKSAPSPPQSWHDAACNQRPEEPPAMPQAQPGNIRPAPTRNFHAGNSALRRQQKSPQPAGAISRELWPRRFAAADLVDPWAKDITTEAWAERIHSKTFETKRNGKRKTPQVGRASICVDPC